MFSQIINFFRDVRLSLLIYKGFGQIFILFIKIDLLYNEKTKYTMEIGFIPVNISINEKKSPQNLLKRVLFRISLALLVKYLYFMQLLPLSEAFFIFF